MSGIMALRITTDVAALGGIYKRKRRGDIKFFVHEGNSDAVLEIKATDWVLKLKDRIALKVPYKNNEEYPLGEYYSRTGQHLYIFEVAKSSATDESRASTPNTPRTTQTSSSNRNSNASPIPPTPTNASHALGNFYQHDSFVSQNAVSPPYAPSAEHSSQQNSRSPKPSPGNSLEGNTPSLGRTFYRYRISSATEKDHFILVPDCFVVDYDQNAVRELRAERYHITSRGPFVLNDLAAQAYCEAVVSAKKLLESVRFEQDRLFKENNVKDGEIRELRDRLTHNSTLLDEHLTRKNSSEALFQDLTRLGTRVKSLEREVEQYQQKVYNLQNENKEVVMIKQQLNEEKSIAEQLSRSLQNRDRDIQNKDAEIQRLERALDTAKAEYQRQIAPTNAVPPTKPAPPAPIYTTGVSINENGNAGLAQDQLEELLAYRRMNTLTHVLRDVADQSIESPFPSGFAFSRVYSEFVLQSQGTISNMIAACEIYPPYHRVLSESVVSGYFRDIYLAATSTVDKYVNEKLSTLQQNFGISEWKPSNNANAAVTRFVLSQMQNSVYASFLEHIKQMTSSSSVSSSSLPNAVATFQKLLSELYHYEATMEQRFLDSLNVSDKKRSFPRTLDRTIIDFPVVIFRQFTNFLWISQFSDPSCELEPIPGKVLADARDICTEVTKRRKRGSVSKEIVLIPALSFCSKNDATKKNIVQQGLSFSPDAVEYETSTAAVVKPVHDKPTDTQSSTNTTNNYDSAQTAQSLVREFAELERNVKRAVPPPPSSSSTSFDNTPHDDSHNGNKNNDNNRNNDGSIVSTGMNGSHTHGNGHNITHEQWVKLQKLLDSNYLQQPVLRVGLPNLINTCYLNAALQLLAHCPPIVHFLSALRVDSRDTSMSLLIAIQELLKVMTRARSADDLFAYVSKIKSLIGKLQPDLFAGNGQGDAGTVLRLVIQKLQTMYKTMLTNNLEQNGSVGLCSEVLFTRSPYPVSSSPLHLQAQQAWEAALQREHGSASPAEASTVNSLVPLMYPQRRCVKKCRACQYETYSFETMTMVPLTVPTAEDRHMLASATSSPAQKNAKTTTTTNTTNTNTSTNSTMNKTSNDPLYKITVVVQLLEGSPAMIALPMTLSLNMKIPDFKEQLILQLVTAGRLQIPATSSAAVDLFKSTHFHFCALELVPVSHSQAYELLRFLRAGNGSSDASPDERAATIGDILGGLRRASTINNSRSTSTVKMGETNSVLVACQLAYPAPLSNSYFDNDESSYRYYDVSFAYFKRNLEADPIEMSIPFRLAYQYPAPSDEILTRDIEKLVLRVFPSPLTTNSGDNNNNSSNSPTNPLYSSLKKASRYLTGSKPDASEDIPRSYAAEMFFLNTDYALYSEPPSEFYFQNKHSSAKPNRHNKKSDRIVASISRSDVHSTSSRKNIVDTTSCCEVALYDEQGVHIVEMVKIQDLLMTPRVLVSSTAAAASVKSPVVTTSDNTTATSRSIYGRSTTPTNLRTAAVSTTSNISSSSSTRDGSGQNVSPAGRFTLQEAFQVYSLPRPLQGATCRNCQQRDTVEISYDVWQVGDVLVVQLQRSLGDNGEFSHAINRDMCIFPIEGFDIQTVTSINNNTSTLNNEEKENCYYDLYGVAEHIPLGGSINHYRTFCRVDVQDARRWACFNDSNVSEATIQMLRADQAYLLCYVRRPHLVAQSHTMPIAPTTVSTDNVPTTTYNSTSNTSNNNRSSDYNHSGSSSFNNTNTSTSSSSSHIHSGSTAYGTGSGYQSVSNPVVVVRSASANTTAAHRRPITSDINNNTNNATTTTKDYYATARDYKTSISSSSARSNYNESTYSNYDVYGRNHTSSSIGLSTPSYAVNSGYNNNSSNSSGSKPRAGSASAVSATRLSSYSSNYGVTSSSGSGSGSGSTAYGRDLYAGYRK